MKRVVFTICSNNYLAQALTLGESFKKHNENVRFVICLLDKKKNVENIIKDYDIEIIEIEDILKEKVYELSAMYDIVEFNTSVKPSIFKHFLNIENYGSAIYIDPDIVIFNSLDELFKMQESFDAIVTPHITSSTKNTFAPDEMCFIQTGIYNFGFASFTKSSQTLELLDWWEDKLFSGLCLDAPHRHLFTDQLWMNFTPAFVDKCLVLRHPGYNVAPWNLNERHLDFVDNKFVVNGKPLYFFHFSSMKVENNGCLPYSTKLMSEIPYLDKIFDIYKERILKNHIQELSQVVCAYETQPLGANNNGTKKKKEKGIKKLVKSLKKKFVKKDA